MKDKELNSALTADAGLDEALAQMAEEVPPMPADFHDRWMNAVRADAQQKAEPARGGTPPRRSPPPERSFPWPAGQGSSAWPLSLCS